MLGQTAYEHVEAICLFNELGTLCFFLSTKNIICPNMDMKNLLINQTMGYL